MSESFLSAAAQRDESELKVGMSEEPRTITAWAAKEPKAALEQITFEAPPLSEDGVEISVTHCGLCGSDVHLINSDGGYSDFTAYVCEPKKPQSCGHEVIGTVTGLGKKVKHLKLGQRAGIGWQNSACHECEWCKAGGGDKWV